MDLKTVRPYLYFTRPTHLVSIAMYSAMRWHLAQDSFNITDSNNLGRYNKILGGKNP